MLIPCSLEIIMRACLRVIFDMKYRVKKKLASFLIGDFYRGLKDSMPICLAFLFMCISFGGFAKAANMSLSETMAMAMLIYSIPLQVILVKAISGGVSIATVALLSLIINGRFFLMSLSIIPYLNRGAKKLIPSLFLLSASSFTVSHVKFTSDQPKNPFRYYLGVASAAYVTTFFSSLIGFYIVFSSDSIILKNVFSIALGIHFTALTAMRWPKIKHVVSTFLGFALLPLFANITSLDVSFILTPVVIGATMLFVPSRNKEVES